MNLQEKSKMENVNLGVRLFAKFIEDNWRCVEDLLKLSGNKTSILSDWMQSNWEILVENLLCHTNEYLDIYGDGADCNEKSSRVFMPTALPTHEIYCQGKEPDKKIKDFLSQELIEIKDKTFNRFISWDGKRYSDAPPLKYVLLENDDDEFIVALEDVKFNIRHK